MSASSSPPLAAPSYPLAACPLRPVSSLFPVRALTPPHFIPLRAPIRRAPELPSLRENIERERGGRGGRGERGEEAGGAGHSRFWGTITSNSDLAV